MLRPWLNAALATMVVTAGILAPSPIRAEGRLPKLIGHIDDLWRGESSHAVIRMRIKTEHYSRTLKMETWSQGKERSLVRIKSPVKERGAATLKSGRHIYTYLPKTDRTIRLTSGMMSGSWMGSHFTNDDLVKESRMLDDYVASAGEEREVDGRTHLDIVLTPKPDAAVVWGRVIMTAELERKIPIRQVYYDEDLEPVRTIYFEEVTKLAGRDAPSILRIVPEDEPTESTELKYQSLELGVDLPASMFSIARLRKR